MQSVLPSGAIAMDPFTPFAGLLKWCVLAPLYKQNSTLYSQLHLSLLNSILEVPPVNPPKAIGAPQLAAPVGHICRYIVSLQTKLRKSSGDRTLMVSSNKELNLALDRYAQAVQVALYVRCVYGNMEDFMQQLLQLPYNKLLNIVISTHKKTKLL